MAFLVLREPFKMRGRLKALLAGFLERHKDPC
jgi:hypothetical protein